MLVEPRSARSPTSSVSGPPKGVPPTDGAVPARAVTLQMHGQPLIGRWRPRGGVAHCLVLGRRGQPTGRDGCSAAGPHSDEAGGTCGPRCCPGTQRGRAADARFARSLDHTDGLWLSQRCRSRAHPGTGFGGPPAAGRVVQGSLATEAADASARHHRHGRPSRAPSKTSTAREGCHEARERGRRQGQRCGSRTPSPRDAASSGTVLDCHNEGGGEATHRGEPSKASPGRQALECPGSRGGRRPDLGRRAR